ncbi:MAG: YkoF family thiamine/hydroxymethylpyrimidine-binding protein [Pseudomonadota bacterium]
MRVAVDISLYPLREGYIEPIKDVIARLQAHADISVEVNRLSTQLIGDYDCVMQALKTEIQPSLDKDHQAVFVIKILNADTAGF